MTVEQIARKIEDPSLCKIEDVAEIESLIQKYPYAQTFPLLLLQTLGKTKDIRFEDALSQHAFKISDRKNLYFLINESEQHAITSEIAVEEIESVFVSAEIEIEPENVKVEDISDLIEETEVDHAIEELDPIEETKAETISKSVLEIEEIPELKTENFEIVREEIEISTSADSGDFAFVKVEEMEFEPVSIHIDEHDSFVEAIEEDAGIIAHEAETLEEIAPTIESQENASADETESISPAIESEENSFEDESRSETEHKLESTEDVLENETVNEFEPANEIEEKSLDSASFASFDPTKEIIATETIEKFETVEPSEFAIESKAIEFEAIEKTENIDADELTSNAISEGYQVRLEKEEEQTAEETVKDFESQLADEKRSFTDWLKASAITHSKEYEVKQQRIEQIVDKFIEEDPKLTRISKTDIPEKKSAEFFKVSKIAKASISDKAIPVSETLAQIFEAQGNYSKAIDLYEQLILLNPEKKSFFANQIKKLKKK